MPHRLVRSSLACWLLLACVAAACQRDVESVRAELAVRQASWGRQIESIRAQHTALSTRLRGKAGSLAPNASPAAARLQASLDGLRQSVVDVEIQIRQVGPRIEAAGGGDAAEKALEQETARVNEYMRGLMADVVGAGNALDDFKDPKTSDDSPESVNNE